MEILSRQIGVSQGVLWILIAIDVLLNQVGDALFSFDLFLGIDGLEVLTIGLLPVVRRHVDSCANLLLFSNEPLLQELHSIIIGIHFVDELFQASHVLLDVVLIESIVFVSANSEHRFERFDVLLSELARLAPRELLELLVNQSNLLVLSLYDLVVLRQVPFLSKSRRDELSLHSSDQILIQEVGALDNKV